MDSAPCVEFRGMPRNSVFPGAAAKDAPGFYAVIVQKLKFLNNFNED
jgi:hypothetical protein